MSTDRLDFLLDIIEIILNDEEIDAQIREQVRNASNLISRAAHPENYNDD